MSTLQERAIRIIARQLRVPPAEVTPTAHLLEDLHADSLDIVDLTIALEDEFSTDGHPLTIEEDTAAELHTVQDVFDFLARHAGA